jgi:hypothetical protein
MAAEHVVQARCHEVEQFRAADDQGVTVIQGP